MLVRWGWSGFSSSISNLHKMISKFSELLFHFLLFHLSLLQKISERAFDGLNNLQRLNLENNRLKLLERGIFTGVPALIYLNLMKNSLETITYNNILPLMDNLVNNTNSILDITGALWAIMGFMNETRGYLRLPSF